MEASVFQAPATLSRSRISIGLPPLRLRTDEQLVALFRRGHDEAFRAIYDRYHKRLLAYARQMLPRRQDAEDALQDVFVRAYFGLRAHDRDLALRAWLFRVAHNRCIDELRRPVPPPPEVMEMLRTPVHDPVAAVESRESLRRLIADVRRLPDQQRSALLMRELDGMSYEDLAGSLDVTVPAVKSLLVRARVGLAQAAEARDTACAEIRQQLVGAHDEGVRPNALARRHMRDCSACRSFRGELRGMSRELAALAPALGPIAALAKLWAGSFSARRLTGGACTATGSGAGTSGGTASTVGALGAGGSASSAGLSVGVNHLAALIAAAAATGGAVELQHTLAPSPSPAPPAVQSVTPQRAVSAPRQVVASPAQNPLVAAVSTPSTAPPPTPLGNGNPQRTVTPAPTSPAAKPAPQSGVAPQTLVIPGPPPSSGTSSTGSGTASGSGSPSALGVAGIGAPSGSSQGTSGTAGNSSGTTSSPSGPSAVSGGSGSASGTSGSTTSGSSTGTSGSTQTSGSGSSASGADSHTTSSGTTSSTDGTTGSSGTAS